jgi:hypothetical protein
LDELYYLNELDKLNELDELELKDHDNNNFGLNKNAILQIKKYHSKIVKK